MTRSLNPSPAQPGAQAPRVVDEIGEIAQGGRTSSVSFFVFDPGCPAAKLAGVDGFGTPLALARVAAVVVLGGNNGVFHGA
jgi:hypothetical protein